MIYSDIEVGHVYRSVEGTIGLCLLQMQVDYFDIGWIHWFLLDEIDSSFMDAVWWRTSQFRGNSMVREQYTRGQGASWIKVA